MFSTKVCSGPAALILYFLLCSSSHGHLPVHCVNTLIINYTNGTKNIQINVKKTKKTNKNTKNILRLQNWRFLVKSIFFMQPKITDLPQRDLQSVRHAAPSILTALIQIRKISTNLPVEQNKTSSRTFIKLSWTTKHTLLVL